MLFLHPRVYLSPFFFPRARERMGSRSRCARNKKKQGATLIRTMYNLLFAFFHLICLHACLLHGPILHPPPQTFSLVATRPNATPPRIISPTAHSPSPSLLNLNYPKHHQIDPAAHTPDHFQLHSLSYHHRRGAHRHSPLSVGCPFLA